jgi:flagellar motor switch protein FliG
VDAPSTTTGSGSMVEYFGGFVGAGWVESAKAGGVAAEPCTPDAGTHFLLPDGTAAKGEDAYAILMNPFGQEAVYTARIFTPGQAPVETPEQVVRPHHAVAVHLNEFGVIGQATVGAEIDVSLGRLSAAIERRPFEFLRRTPPEQVHAFLKDESPQTIALVVASVHSTLAAKILAELPPELQSDVALRIATMSETNPDVIRDIEQGLRLKLANVVGQEFAAAGGVDALAEILNRAGRSTERNVVGAISESDQELADEIKLRLFTFEDLVILEDRDLQLVLREVDQKELQLALRGCDPPVVEKILGNMSQRGAEMLREDMENSAPQKKAVVEEAQGKVVAAVRRLEDAGALVIRRGAEEEEEVV